MELNEDVIDRMLAKERLAVRYQRRPYLIVAPHICEAIHESYCRGPKEGRIAGDGWLWLLKHSQPLLL